MGRTDKNRCLWVNHYTSWDGSQSQSDKGGKLCPNAAFWIKMLKSPHWVLASAWNWSCHIQLLLMSTHVCSFSNSITMCSFYFLAHITSLLSNTTGLLIRSRVYSDTGIRNDRRKWLIPLLKSIQRWPVNLRKKSTSSNWPLRPLKSSLHHVHSQQASDCTHAHSSWVEFVSSSWNTLPLIPACSNPTYYSSPISSKAPQCTCQAHSHCRWPCPFPSSSPQGCLAAMCVPQDPLHTWSHPIEFNHGWGWGHSFGLWDALA